MSLFSRLFSSKQPRLRRFPDSFTLTDSRKKETLCQWVKEQSQQQTVLVLTHFQSTFLETQSTLQEAGLDFEILTSAMDSSQLNARLAEQSVWLTMSQMLQPRDNSSLAVEHQMSDTPNGLAVIVTERYPLLERDRMLETFLLEMPRHVALGYLISFEDPILKHLLGDKFIDLMKQLGLGDNDLVSSTMTNRGLARKLKSATATIEQEKLASSPQEWIELNFRNTSAK